MGRARARGAASPTAVGLSGQMHGVVLADAASEPVRSVTCGPMGEHRPSWAEYDRLGADALARLGEPDHPGPGRARSSCGCSRYDESTLARARWALQPKDWLRTRMTGVVLTEPSDASATLLYDVPGERWDTEVIEALGLDQALFPAARVMGRRPSGPDDVVGGGRARAGPRHPGRRGCGRHRTCHVRQWAARARPSSADAGLRRSRFCHRRRPGRAGRRGDDLVPDGGPARLVRHGGDEQCRPGIGLGAHAAGGNVGGAVRSSRLARGRDRSAVPATDLG